MPDTYVAGISYELIRLAGRSDFFLVNLLSAPGMLIQRLTTKEPDRDMIEVAIASIEAVFDWKEFLVEHFDADKEELDKLKPMPFMAMVASVGKNDEPDMYNYLGGVKNGSRSEDLDAAFKQDNSNFHIVIVVDMWITGFDVPSLTYMYNDKPLKKHLLRIYYKMHQSHQ